MNAFYAVFLEEHFSLRSSVTGPLGNQANRQQLIPNRSC
jgi:hypothetical protein